MTDTIKRNWPLIINLLVYWVILLILVMISLNRNGGNFIYPLDDTYIHMAIAKNAALHEVWGITKHGFTSTTSSPLWTFILYISYLIFGVNEIAPFIMNIFAGTLVIICSYFFLKKYIVKNIHCYLVLQIAVIVTPLPVLTLTGMEHVLHLLLTIVFVYLSAQYLSSEENIHKYNLLILAPFLVMSRYEALFAVLGVCILLLTQKKIFYALMLGFTAILPVILYGYWSIVQGWMFFPNSLLLKGTIPGISFTNPVGIFTRGFLRKIIEYPHLLFIFCCTFALLYISIKKLKVADSKSYLIIILSFIVLLHLQFASIGFFYRYEAYIIFLSLIVFGSFISYFHKLPAFSFKKLIITKKRMISALMIVLFLSFISRTIFAIIETPVAATNIYQQQYQMGLFLNKFYNNRTIALNDIGAPCFLADIRLLDLWGLGSLEPAKLKMDKQFERAEVSRLAVKNNVEFAIIYDVWYIDKVPYEWALAGNWIIPDNVVCRDSIVSFYSVNKFRENILQENLRSFSQNLPSEVTQTGKYIK